MDGSNGRRHEDRDGRLVSQLFSSHSDIMFSAIDLHDNDIQISGFP